MPDIRDFLPPPPWEGPPVPRGLTHQSRIERLSAILHWKRLPNGNIIVGERTNAEFGLVYAFWNEVKQQGNIVVEKSWTGFGWQWGGHRTYTTFRGWVHGVENNLGVAIRL